MKKTRIPNFTNVSQVRFRKILWPSQNIWILPKDFFSQFWEHVKIFFMTNNMYYVYLSETEEHLADIEIHLFFVKTWVNLNIWHYKEPKLGPFAWTCNPSKWEADIWGWLEVRSAMLHYTVNQRPYWACRQYGHSGGTRGWLGVERCQLCMQDTSRSTKWHQRAAMGHWVS